MIELQAADQRTFAWLAGGEPFASAPVLCPGGIAPAEVLAVIADMAARVRSAFAGDSAWLIVAEGEAVGLISYKDAPGDGIADIGYGIGEARQRRGHATQAVRALAGHARANGIRTLTAETSVDNQPSQQVLRKAGFTPVGERDDPEDGPLICWACELAEGIQE